MSKKNSTPIFSLDIGTRSIVGLLLQKNKTDLYEILDIEILEHDERSMLDGQIHNVIAVSETIKKIKDKLESRHGQLKKVCVAAAGRSLKTKRASVDLDIKGMDIGSEDVFHLELSAVQQAQFDLATEFEDQKSFNYFCVGYSVLDYRLDGEKIGSLIEQTGTTASVEVIATFLPKVVVESLIAALSKANLELEALTLEPIAAINVLIPPSMRRLNVALVDIGAGTSDIAITDEGTVVAYGMVPVAGDEITEALSDQFLLDFPDAETMKRQLNEVSEVTITDILGFDTTMDKNEVVNAITGAIDELATAITTEILELNQKPPKAVMLVGGGSMTPNLGKHIAEKLRLPENRVAIRGIDAIRLIEQTDKVKAGPELVTPIGIAIASKENPIEYISIKVNERAVRLFDIKKLTVGDGLLAAGIEISKLYGKPGMALMLEVNERLISVPGQHGKSPTIIKNGELTTIDASIKANDVIHVERGTNGTMASATIEDVVGELPTIHLTINNRPVALPAIVYKNGEITTTQAALQDRDKVKIKVPNTIEQVLTVAKISVRQDDFKPFYVFVDDKKMVLTSLRQALLRNGKEADLTTPIANGDRITIEVKKPALTVEDVCSKLSMQATKTITVFFNGEPVTLSKPSIKLIRNGLSLSASDTVQNGDYFRTEFLETSPFIFQDLFRYVDVDVTPTGNSKLLVLKNGENAGFSDTIETGDNLEVRMEPILNG
ncbi:cell division protein FtsA [Bacillus alkalicellulosilyticus]|uniref:cell division protein FtsA n=1 Tax=Alkalihalobacterium alkalicellulosilyticum TaxID=1912214 RepID=UPI000996F05E|nr:cell division protein FtsA [Bacillus alkalicellulosilyticus]